LVRIVIDDGLRDADPGDLLQGSISTSVMSAVGWASVLSLEL
jgi:hypothetical protein